MERLGVLLFGLLLPVVLTGQPLTGNKTIPGDFATIEEAIISLNVNGVGSGGVTFNVAAGHSETFSGPAKGTITTASSSETNPIFFQKSGSGANPLIFSGTGTGLTTDGIIKLLGTDYITFDGIDVQENPVNTNPTEWMEWGYALLKSSGTNGSQHVTIKNCTITLDKSNTASTGIYGGNHTATSVSQLTVTSVNGTNSWAKIYNNTISNCYKGISINGFNAPSPYTYYDLDNEIGKDGANNITNFGGSGVAAYGIYARYQNGIEIGNNMISGGNGTTNILYGIYLGVAMEANADIYSNTVSIVAGGTTVESGGIGNESGGTGSVNVINIFNNNIFNCTYSTATTGSFYGINNVYVYPRAATANIYNNSVHDNSYSGTGSFYGIYGGNPSTLNIYSDTVYNNQHLGIKGYLYCVYVENSAIFFHHNHLHHNSMPSTSGTSGNTFLYGYYCIANMTTEEYHDNEIHDLTMGGTSTTLNCELVGMELGGVLSGTRTVYNNNIYGLSSSLRYCDVAGIITRWGVTVHLNKNRLYDISCTGTSGQVYGLSVRNSTGTNLYIYNNFISDIKAPNSSVIVSITGLHMMAGNNYVYNNTVFLNANTITGSRAIYSMTDNFLELRNNIIVNISTFTDIYKTVALAYASAFTENYSLLSNNNCFYAGIPGPQNLIYSCGSTKCSTLEEFKALVSPREQGSVSEMPPFVNITAAPYDLHISSGTPTVCESGALIITTPYQVNSDFDDQPRFPWPGYPDDPLNPATAPDIGADEFGGITGSKTLNLSLFLEGLFNSSTGLMNEAIDGNTGLPKFGTGTADQITVGLHDAANYGTVLYTAGNVNLDITGTASITIPAAYNGSYHITVNHRNSIETTTALPVSFAPGTISYDFTATASQAYGDNMKLAGSEFVIWGGDVNQDDIVDSGDMNLVENGSALVLMGYVAEDVNGDGIVDSGDMNIVENNSMAVIQVITP